MHNYTKHQCWRIRDLNEKYFEVVIAKGNLKFKAGDAVTLFNSDTPPIWIASGIGEAWVRVIMNRDIFTNFDFGSKSIKLDSEVQSLIPDLMSEEKPSFLITSSGISPFFSYVSTYPEKKCKICYMGDDIIQENWIKSNHKLVDLKTIKKAKNLYIIGDREILEPKAGNLLNTCNARYLI